MLNETRLVVLDVARRVATSGYVMAHLERTLSYERERPARMRLAALIREESSPEGRSYAQGQMSMGRRILVIDHDDEARDIVCDHLLRLGFSVAREDNGISGLVRIVEDKARAPFDGLVLELDMPVLGGMAILQEMRERHPEIPVLVTAISGQIKRLRDAMNLGAKEYLVKPFDTELFTRKCRRIFWDVVGPT